MAMEAEAAQVHMEGGQEEEMSGPLLVTELQVRIGGSRAELVAPPRLLLTYLALPFVPRRTA